MRITKIGYSAGERELVIPNFLRVYLGESIEDIPNRDEIMLVETNMDDTNPEVLGYVSERLFSQGTLDVFMTPIFMKKDRSAVTPSVLIEPQKLNDMFSVIFRETSTFGVRLQRLERRKLLGGVVSIETEFGNVKVKIGKINDRIKIVAPEYESCRKIAIEKKIPFKIVYARAKEAMLKTLTQAEGRPSH